jgi:hypothetical protein
MAEVMEFDCGCESVIPSLYPVSWCCEHAPGMRAGGQVPERMYRCGECGLQTEQWERLESHVYRVHLGVRSS